MTKINAVCLYYISFAPLWLAIIFMDVKNIVQQENNLYTEKIMIMGIIILFIISSIIAHNLMTDKRKSNSEKYTIVNARKSKNITIEFFLAYILPLFAFDFTKWDQVFIFFIFFVSLGFLCIKHNYFTANIVLELLKYDFYECTLKNTDGEEIEKYIISKKNLLYEDNIYLKSINNEYMIEPKM